MSTLIILIPVPGSFYAIMNLTMENRYQRNIPSITESEQEQLKNKKVAILGCGGLGGYLCEFCARLGIGNIIVCDGDVFEASNLNRQILSTEGNLGTLKAEAAKAYIECTNPACRAEAICQMFSADNASFLKDCDVIMDALDNIESRLLLEKHAEAFAVPLIHGAVSGWSGQVCLILPGKQTLQRLYQDASDAGQKTVLPFTASACASLQMSLALKVLTGKNGKEDEALLIFDLLSGEFERIKMEEE